MKIYDKIPDFLLDIMHDPKKLTDTMLSTFNAAKDWLASVITGESSLLGTVGRLAGSIVTGGATGVIEILKRTGAGQKIINWISKNVPGYIDSGVEMLSKIYPLVMSGLSAFTVLMSGDYKE